ncbi:MAG: FtsW/RodA/SpoVE family cell cycle protein [Acidobacteriota bacterium]
MRLKPSHQLLIILTLTALNIVGYLAVIWAGTLRGYLPNPFIAVRDILIFIPFLIFFFWLIRWQHYRGDLTLLTATLLLFSIGNVAQFRLFSDPEYGVRGQQKYEARTAKMQTILKRNIETAYDERKKIALYGDAEAKPPAPDTAVLQRESSISKLLTSQYTYVPIIGIIGMAVAFLFLRRDTFLSFIQNYSLTIGLFTFAAFLVLVFFSVRGKFLGNTTPWEPAKILFLFSFAGILTDNYRILSQTRWGLPPRRILIPFLAVAGLPILPFFVLSDFGQMLVFFGVYALLLFISVRKVPQIIYATLLSAAFAPIFYFGIGIPDRLKLRVHLWLNTWQAPPAETAWWQPFFNRIQSEYGSRVISNLDAWFDQASQIALGLFGIEKGGLWGQGLGLGFPEVVPVSDSDFIYAAIAEELGLLGGLVIIIALAALIFAGLRIAIEAQDMFTKLIAAGVTGFLGLQALVNLGGVLRLLPMTGITLPFVSHGGSSLITSFVMLGILMAISQRNAEVVR